MGYLDEKDAIEKMDKKSTEAALAISQENIKRQIQRKDQIYNFEDQSIPDQRCNNVNLTKIIWQLKLRTTLLNNVLDKIINKWPEDRVSFLEIVERNKKQFESAPPKDLFDLVEKDVVSYNDVIENKSFNVGESIAYPSRVQQSKRGYR